MHDSLSDDRMRGLRTAIAVGQIEANSEWFAPGNPLTQLDTDIDAYWLRRFNAARSITGERLG